MLDTDKKTEIAKFRISKNDLLEIKRKAVLYAGGNLSRYFIYCAKTFVPSKAEIKKGSK